MGKFGFITINRVYHNEQAAIIGDYIGGFTRGHPVLYQIGILALVLGGTYIKHNYF